MADDAAFQPWMLRSDWRTDRRQWLWVDLANWPEDVPIDPLPPVPLIGTGPASHPQAPCVDLLVEEGFSLDQLATAIERSPQAAATVVQLLRATEGLAPLHALTLESFAYAMLQGGAEHERWLASRQPSTAPHPPGTVHVSRRVDRLNVVLDRPEMLNAIDRGMRDALFDAFSLAAIDEEITTVRVRSTGRAFSIGADLTEFGTTRAPVDAHAIRARTLPAWPMLRRQAIYDVHVQGSCVGSGLELAAFAARLTASPAAWFQLPEVGMGILPGFGGCVSVPRRVGRQRAALLMLSGKRIGGRTALQWGLVDALVNEPAPDADRTHQLGG